MELPGIRNPLPSARRSISLGLTAILMTVFGPTFAARAETAPSGMGGKIDAAFGVVNDVLGSFIFYPVPVGGGDAVPLAVLILVLGAVFFTVRLGFPQFKATRHAIEVVRGRYDSPDDPGEVSSFQALTAALSATVGLGNIGGVAVAIGTGGAGATFWMILCGFLGMAAKFAEVTLGQMYRRTRPDGRVMGGGMYYLSTGLAELGHAKLGRFLAVWFCIICIGASFGGGNTFQVSQSVGAVGEVIPFFKDNRWVYGLAMAVAVGIVILGGITRIAKTAERIVPLMCGIYVVAALIIIVMRIDQVPAAVSAIVTEAFTPRAGFGGALGVLIIGFKRAAFSNEAGLGSSAIAHSAAKTPYAVREGVVALLEPLIDTIFVCTITALVIVITGAHINPAYADIVSSGNGAALTSKAMAEVLPFFPYVLAVAVMLFAFSTMISWSYYGERCWAYLFGDSSSTVYRVIFVIFTFLGSIATANNIINFGDLLILGLVFPNAIGVVMLSGKIRAALDDYFARYRRGEFKTYD